MRACVRVRVVVTGKVFFSTPRTPDRRHRCSFTVSSKKKETRRRRRELEYENLGALRVATAALRCPVGLEHAPVLT